MPNYEGKLVKAKLIGLATDEESLKEYSNSLLKLTMDEVIPVSQYLCVKWMISLWWPRHYLTWSSLKIMYRI